MVTVVVTDSGVDSKNKMTAMRDVVIEVTNAEDEGTVTFSSVQPLVGVPFTAFLKDGDGMTTGVKWEWRKTAGGDEGTPIECSTTPTFETDAIAKTATYTPKAADRYQCLQAIATYTDPYGSDTMEGVSTNAVAADMSNRAPQFKDGDVEITAKTIRVNENIKRDDDASPPELGYVVFRSRPPILTRLTFSPTR